MKWALIAEQVVTRWSGGETCQLLIYPKGATLEKRDFAYRVSSATVTQEESQFTRFEGYDRWIASLDRPLQLKHRLEEKVQLDPLMVHQFRGEDETTSWGVCRDFNLMLKRPLRGSIGLVENQPRLLAAGHLLVYAFEEAVTLVVDETLIKLEREAVLLVESGQTLRLKAKQGRAVYAHVEIDGEGET